VNFDAPWQCVAHNTIGLSVSVLCIVYRQRLVDFSVTKQVSKYTCVRAATLTG